MNSVLLTRARRYALGMAQRGVSLTIDVSGALRKLDAAGQRVGNMAKPARQIGLYAASEARKRLNERPRNWGNHTGQLARSIHSTFDESTGTIRIGTNLIYARVQEIGGEIRPKKKYLAIPVDDSLRRSGKWPRDFGKGELQFVRKALIQIHGREWWGPALVTPENEKQRERTKQRKANERKRRKKRLRGSVIQVALRERREGQRQARRVMFALVKMVTLKGDQPYLLAPETVKNVRQFAADALERHISGKG